MKRVLIVAYHFPPQPGGGVQRSAKFVRYLPDFGWRPTVVTIDGTLHGRLDTTLLADVAAAEVVRVRPSVLPEMFVRNRVLRGALDQVLVPDSHVAWLPIARRAISRLWRSQPFDVVYTSCRPFSLAALGAELQLEYGVPWVLDLRDLWTLNPTFSSMAPFATQRRAHAREEAAAIEACSHLVVTSRASLRAMRRRYPGVTAKSDCIPNGFDASDFAGPAPARADDVFRLVYAGACYPPYSTDRIFGLIRRWHETTGVACEIHYAGLHEDAFMRAAVRSRVGGMVRSHGHLPHSDSIALMRSADALLLFLPEIPEAEGWVPGKLYEYLACGAPIVACLGPGDAADIIADARAGIVIGPEASWSDAVAAFDRMRTVGPQPRRADAVEQHERRGLTAQLASIFDKVRAAAPEQHAPTAARA